MTHVDTINACFEAGGALLLCINVYRLRRDKTVKGVSLWPAAWWNLWGFWNVYFYSAVNTPASFWAGVAVVLVNSVWMAHALYYRRAESRRTQERQQERQQEKQKEIDDELRGWQRRAELRIVEENEACPGCGGLLVHARDCTAGRDSGERI